MAFVGVFWGAVKFDRSYNQGAFTMKSFSRRTFMQTGAAAALALKKGLLIITAGSNVLRFVPPLIVSRDDIDQAVAILDEVLDEI